jgi:type 1 glutamine amidotransferase
MAQKKALCTWGGWEGHTPEKSMGIMKNFLEKEGFEVNMVHSLKPLEDMKYLASLNLIVFCWTGSKIKKKQEQNLLNAVMKGVGLTGWHGGLDDAFRNNVEYQFMCGAQWVAHPGGAGMTYDVNFVNEKKKDPIIQDLVDFKITSEQYFLHCDPSLEVLATTTFHSQTFPWIEGIRMPVIYKKQWGDGKIFYSSLGHTFKDFDVPQVLESYKRGMLWAATQEKLVINVSASMNALQKSF